MSLFEAVSTASSRESILAEYARLRSNAGRPYSANVNDTEYLLAEAVGYQLSKQAGYFQNIIAGLNLNTASGTALDDLALTLFAVKRAAGAKPTATATFTLTAVRTADVLVYKGFTLSDADGRQALLLDDVRITAGQTTVQGTVELQEYVVASQAKTTIMLNPLPYLEKVELAEFAGGALRESDADLRKRCELARQNPSTAGSVASYRYQVFSADSRIAEVDIHPTSNFRVQVYYHSPQADSTMQSRVEQALKDEKVKPLGDYVAVQAATLVHFDVEASCSLPVGVDRAAYLQKIQAGKASIEGLLKLSGGISRFQIANTLSPFADILQVNITKPATDIAGVRGTRLLLNGFSVGLA